MKTERTLYDFVQRQLKSYDKVPASFDWDKGYESAMRAIKTQMEDIWPKLKKNQ